MEPSEGAPWILGARGAPLEAPENTRAGFAAALAHGLDGVASDVRACLGGDLVLIADATLERTTDGHGHVAERPWRELCELDAGASFHARFRGQRPMLLDEALRLRAPGSAAPQHLLRLHRGPGESADALARSVAACVHELEEPRRVLVASEERATVLALESAGLRACAVVDALDQRSSEQVLTDRPAALAAPIHAWLGAEGAASWPVERWSLDVDAPDDLLAACRAGLTAFTTREPRRALAARALTRLAPGCDAWPVQVPELTVEPRDADAFAGEWRGSWAIAARVANPFGWPVRAACALALRRGAFDVRGLPARLELAPGQEAEVAFELTGGSRSPGGDPLLEVGYAWRAGPGRGSGALLLDAALARVRRVTASRNAVRLSLLRESPGDEAASLVLRRHGRALSIALENAGGLHDARVVARIGRHVVHGLRSVKLALPSAFDDARAGVPFSCAITAWRDGERVWRRWAGGLPDEPSAGEAGILLPDAAINLP